MRASIVRAAAAAAAAAAQGIFSFSILKLHRNFIFQAL
jgi:hypothetical protein